jgi:hypothetical protein
VHRPFALLVLLVTACVCACGGDDAADPSTASVDASSPQVVVTESGRFATTLSWSSGVPVKGNNRVELRLTTRDNAPISGATVTLLPWMPAHAHGTSVKPTVVETAPGVFSATSVYLYMAGQWQLRIGISGSIDDSAIATYDVR